MEYDDYPLALGPRGRRGVRIAVLVALVLVVSLVALRLTGRARLAELRRGLADLGPAPPAEGAPPGAAPGRHGARAMATAGAAIGSRETALRELPRRRPAEWAVEDWATVHEYLAAHAATLASLERASRLPGGGRLADGPEAAGADGFSRPLFDLLAAVYLLRLEAVDAAWSGDPERAARAVATLGRLQGLLGDEPQLMAQAIVLVTRSAALQATREILGRRAPGAATLAGLREALAPPAAPPCRALAWEALQLSGAGAAGRVRRMTRDDGPGWALASRLGGEWLLAEALRTRPVLSAGCGQPYGALMASADAARSRWPLGPLRRLDVEARGFVLRAAGVEASRRLAVVALQLAGGAAGGAAYPPALPVDLLSTDPLTGTRPAYGRRPDGSAWLALPAAEAKSHSRLHLRSLPYFWELPPPG